MIAIDHDHGSTVGAAVVYPVLQEVAKAEGRQTSPVGGSASPTSRKAAQGDRSAAAGGVRLPLSFSERPGPTTSSALIVIRLSQSRATSDEQERRHALERAEGKVARFLC